MTERLRQILLSPWLARVVRWGIGLLFLYAGVLKLRDPEAFAVVIHDFGLVTWRWAEYLAYGLPLVEIAAALGLLADRRGALATTAGLLLLFIIVVSYALWQGLDIDCGCFGPSDPEYRAYRGLWTTFYRDLAMVGGVLYLYWWRNQGQLLPGSADVSTAFSGTMRARCPRSQRVADIMQKRQAYYADLEEKKRQRREPLLSSLRALQRPAR